MPKEIATLEEAIDGLARGLTNEVFKMLEDQGYSQGPRYGRATAASSP